MTNRYGRISRTRLETCDPRLQRIVEAVLPKMDHSILCGHRGQQEQDAAFNDGVSKLRFPYSKHNSWPSQAIDLAPWFKQAPHIRWNDIEAFHALAAQVMAEADRQGVCLRWGGDWDGDGDTTDQTFNDLVHFELME